MKIQHGIFLNRKRFTLTASEMIFEKDGVKTAICPICGIDSVLGDASVEITAEILEALNEYYF